MKKIITVVGARPQFIKAAVVSKAFKEINIPELIIHTGQHYDLSMSDIFWDELGIPVPEINLGVGSGTHGEQTAKMLTGIEQQLLKHLDSLAALLVYGDTNSTIAGALAASKLHIPVVHVEAGLRSFNREMPEEINRVLTDHISDLLFCPSNTSVEQLKKEGIEKGVFETGDVMYDAVLTFSKIAEQKITLSDLISFEPSEYILFTLHRPSNTDHPEHLKSIFNALAKIDKPILWPVHPRIKNRLSRYSLPANLKTIEPVSYFQMLVLLKNAFKVMTDSGGLQKEAYWMEKPVITLRSETEWTETLEGGWNILTGHETDTILEAYHKSPVLKWHTLYGNGMASQKIAAIIKNYLSR